MRAPNLDSQPSLTTLTDANGSPIGGGAPLPVGPPGATSTNPNGYASTVNTGQAKIATTGTAVQLSSTSKPTPQGVTLQALASNSAAITVGGSGVNATTDGTGNGKVLVAGQSWAFAVSDLNALWINGPAGAGIDWSY